MEFFGVSFQDCLIYHTVGKERIEFQQGDTLWTTMLAPTALRKPWLARKRWSTTLAEFDQKTCAPGAASAYPCARRVLSLYQLLGIEPPRELIFRDMSIDTIGMHMHWVVLRWTPDFNTEIYDSGYFRFFDRERRQIGPDFTFDQLAFELLGKFNFALARLFTPSFQAT